MFGGYNTRGFNIKDYGGFGNGVNDDTAAFLSGATDAMAVNGTLFIPRGRFRITDITTLTGNINIEGEEGSVLYINPASNKDAYFYFDASGSTTTYSLSGNALVNATGISISGTGASGFSAGDMFYITDNRNGGRWPYEVREVIGVSTGTAELYFSSPLTCDYLTGNSSTIVKLAPRSVNIRNIDFEFQSGASVTRFIVMNQVKNSVIENVRFINHRCSSGATVPMGIHVNVGFNVQILNNTMNFTTGNVNNIGIKATGVERLIISNNVINGYWNGIYSENNSAPMIHDNIVKGKPTGTYGIRCIGNQYASIQSNNVSNFNSQNIRCDDSGRYTISNNIINVGDQAIGITAATGNTADHAFNLITNNRIENMTSYGVVLDAYSQHTLISNNYIKDIGKAGIRTLSTLYALITNNEIINHGTGYTTGSALDYAGIYFGLANQVNGNKVWGLGTPAGVDAYTFTTGNSNVSGTTFINNWAIHSSMSNMAEFWRFTQCHGNSMIGLGQRNTVHSNTPSGLTYYVGDKVWNNNPSGSLAFGWLCYTSGTSTATTRWTPLGFVPLSGTITTDTTGHYATGANFVLVNTTSAITYTLPSSGTLDSSMTGTWRDDFRLKEITIKAIVGSPNCAIAAGATETLEQAYTLTTGYGLMTFQLFGTVWRLMNKI